METSLLQEWMASFHILSIDAIIIYILKGTLFTVIISAIAVFLGVIFGSVLALVRNYCNAPKYRVFKYLAITYIEIFRNTPLLLWIFICVVFCPVPSFFAHKLFGLTTVETKLLFKASIALILFTSSVIAGIIAITRVKIITDVLDTSSIKFPISFLKNNKLIEEHAVIIG